MDYVDVAVIPQALYNVNTVSDLFTNVADDTCLKVSKRINLQTKM